MSLGSGVWFKILQSKNKMKLQALAMKATYHLIIWSLCLT